MITLRDSRNFHATPRRRDRSARGWTLLCGAGLVFASILPAPADTTITYTNGQTDPTAYSSTAGNLLTLTITTGLATQSGVVSGDSVVKKTGAGALVLSGPNTYTGGLAINGGVLGFANAGALGTGTIALGGGSFQATGSDLTVANDFTAVSGSVSSIDTDGHNVTISGTVTATNAQIAKTGAGDLALTGATNAIDSFFALGGSVTQSTGESLSAYEVGVGTGAGSVATYNMNGGSLTTLAGAPPPIVGATAASMRIGDFGGTGTLNQTGGAITINGSLNVGNQGGHGTYNLSGGTLEFATGQSALARTSGTNPSSGGSTGALNLSGTAAVTIDNGAIFTLSNWYPSSGITQGVGVLTQTGGTLAVAAGGILNVTGIGDGTYNLDGGTLQVGGGGFQGAYFGETGSYHFHLGGGTIQVTGSSLTASLDTTLDSSTSSTIDTNGIGATLSGTWTGSGNLIKTGAGTATFTQANSFTGTTSVQQGTVVLGNAAALGTGPATVSSGATLDTAGYGFDLTRLSGAGTATGSGVFSYTSASDQTLATTLAGTANLTKSGTGSLTLTAANSYSGTTSVQQGTVVLGNAAALGNTSHTTVAAGATLNTASYSFNIAPLSGQGTVTGSGSYSYISPSDQTFDPRLAGTATLTKGGTGKLTLTAANTYTGATVVSGGTLRVNGSLAAGSPVTVQSGATLGGTGQVGSVQVDGGGQISLSDQPTTFATADEMWSGGAGYVWKINDATGTQGQAAGWDYLDVTGALTFSGAFTIHVTSLTLGDQPGDAVHLVPGTTYVWTILAASDGLVAFNAGNVTIDTSGFANDPNNSGFTVAKSSDGKSLTLTYTAVPESSGTAILVPALLASILLLRAKRRVS